MRQNRGRQTYELVQKQLTDHPAKQYVPITVSPLGTNSLFVGECIPAQNSTFISSHDVCALLQAYECTTGSPGKGDGEGVSMKTKTQQVFLNIPKCVSHPPSVCIFTDDADRNTCT